MDPETQRLDQPPRDLGIDAHFAVDRSTTAVSRTVPLVTLDARTGRDVPGSATSVTFSGFQIRHALDPFAEVNPVPNQRKTPKQGSTEGKIDTTVAGWIQNATYTFFFSAAARALSPPPAASPRLKVKVLFGTGTEGTRHGVCGALESATDPIMLVIVQGIEPQHDIEFTNPSNPTDKKTLRANNRWGVGLTVPMIERAISRKFGALMAYDITVLAAFSTGYLGLQESIGRSLLPLDRIERIVIFDCLYGSLKSALDRVKAIKPRAEVICYVVTEGGNSFEKSTPVSFSSLVLGRNPAWNYINLMGNVGFNAITSARLISEATSAGNKIIDTLPTDYATAHGALVSVFPPRMTIVSDAAVIRKVRGAIPSGTAVLATFASDKANSVAIGAFFKKIGLTRRCIGRAQLLGWPAPPGEEWHDMLLVEFAWEYLS